MYLCIRCCKREVEEVGSETLHGNINTPASDTEILIEFKCQACGAGYSYDASLHDQTLWPTGEVRRTCLLCSTESRVTNYSGTTGKIWCPHCNQQYPLR